MDQGSTGKRSAVHNFAPTVTKFCVMWEGRALPHDTKFGNCRCEMVGRRVIFIWSLIHGSSWSGLIKAEPGETKCRSNSSHGIDLVLKYFGCNISRVDYWSALMKTMAWTKWFKSYLQKYFWYSVVKMCLNHVFKMSQSSQGSLS